MTRSEWKRERRKAFWARHQALAGGLLGGALFIAPVLFLISKDVEQLSALRLSLLDIINVSIAIFILGTACAFLLILAIELIKVIVDNLSHKK